MIDQRLAFFDTETTGTDPRRNGITQISLEIGYIRDDRYYATRTHNFLLRPFPDDTIEDKALQVQGRTREQIAEGEDPKVVYRKLCDIFGSIVDKYNKKDKMFFVAYNAEFDMGFLRAFWEKNGDQYFQSYFVWPDIDVCRVAGFHLMAERFALPNFKLGTVAEHLGVKMPEGGIFHDAATDIAVTRDLFLTLKGIKSEN